MISTSTEDMFDGDDATDRLLRRAMQALPEPASVPGLAERVIQQSLLQLEANREAAARLLRRQTQVIRFATAAAIVVMAALLWSGAQRWRQLSQAVAADVQMSDSAASSNPGSISSKSDNGPTSANVSLGSSLGWAAMGGCVLAAVLLVLALESALGAGNGLQVSIYSSLG